MVDKKEMEKKKEKILKKEKEGNIKMEKDKRKNGKKKTKNAESLCNLTLATMGKVSRVLCSLR